MPKLIDAMVVEMGQQRHLLEGSELQTVYFGGGTPSLLPGDQLQKLFDTLSGLRLTENAEITLEANPEDITDANLAMWKAAGINRLSIGIQSLTEKDLRHMNRNHNALEAVNSVEKALTGGIHSVNIDLIFGSPWQSHKHWEETLNWAFSCGADHISAYALTVEPKTFLNKMIQSGKWPVPDDGQQAQQYILLAERAEKEGWDFYEVSNLSKPGHRAVHNSNYWANLPYLGIGPSAHSYFNNRRWWNVSDNKKYTEGINGGIGISESETLSESDMLNEYILTNIRTTEGIDIQKLKDGGCDMAVLDSYQNSGHINIHNGRAILTLEGRLMADGITADLMK